jgi:hypothetical protein
MSGGFSEDWPGSQGDGVEIEDSVVAVEIGKKIGDQVGDTAEATNADQGLEDLLNTRELSIQNQIEISAVDPPAIPHYLQDLFNSMIASVKIGNLELASKLENSHKELQSSVEQKIKESNDKKREEIRSENEKVVE